MNEANAKYHAVFAAYLSLLTGTVGVVISIMAADAELSMSLYGMALIEVIDVAASIMVLYIYQPTCFKELSESAQDRIENQYSFMLGGLMFVLGVFLLTDSMFKVVEEDREHLTERNEEMAFAAALYGAVTSLGIAAYNFIIAEKLHSTIIYVDAIADLISGLISTTALIIAANPQFSWWVDGFVGMLLAIYALYSGAHTMISAQRTLQQHSQHDEEEEKLLKVNVISTYSYQTGGNNQSKTSACKHLEEDVEFEEDYATAAQCNGGMGRHTSYGLPYFHSFFHSYIHSSDHSSIHSSEHSSMHSTLAQNQFVVPELDDIPSVSTRSSCTTTSTSSGNGSGSGRSFNRNTFNRYSRSTAVATTTTTTSATATRDSSADQSAAVAGRTDYTAL